MRAPCPARSLLFQLDGSRSRAYLSLGRPKLAPFLTKLLPPLPDVVAPDLSDVRVLLGLTGGGMAHFELAPGRTSAAMTHRTVEEIWYFLAGEGEMWRKQGNQEETVAIAPGVCLTIPLGTHFQFRTIGSEPLAAIAVTMPPWPGEGEAKPVSGPWTATPSDA